MKYYFKLLSNQGEVIYFSTSLEYYYNDDLCKTYYISDGKEMVHWFYKKKLKELIANGMVNCQGNKYELCDSEIYEWNKIQ